ncbi:MAG: shikimate dehydrogenase [Anaerolineales bacterium]|nr:shikimate dehydrogenase [Anaerolineales bacterium]MCB9126639.1 shikimate dehydrogenase [Ardenticatenales bacterium]MCB9172735.1 shikimate dehydrogenase [Ardenticatenales bacterium]
MSRLAVPTRVGLLGWPVAHSRSPAMQNAAFAACGLAWAYLLLPTPPERLADAVRGLRGFGLAGANVTIPHKAAIMPLLDEVTLEARAIGAVNTIVRQGERMIGHNTDALGFLRALREGGFEPRGCRAVLLGAGGAARAVLYALLAARAEVVVVNRTVATANRLASAMSVLSTAPISTLSLHDEALLQVALNEANVLINATSVGMEPHIDHSPLPESISLHEGLAVYDLVYSPRRTRLLEQAEGAGARPIDGLGMLIHQGAVAFELWTGQRAPLDEMRRAAAKAP